MTIVHRTPFNSRAMCFAVLLIGFAMTLAGCQGQPANDDSTSNSEDTNTSGEAESTFGCGDKLTAALEMVRPERFGISTDAGLVEARLNTWLDDCGQTIVAAPPIGPDIESLLDPAMSPSQRKRLGSDRFLSDDPEHLRNCQIHKALARIQLGTVDNELEQVVGLFHFCVRNIGLHSSSDQSLPLTPFQILMFGRGAAEDVAWAYADLLRQLQIDTVIIQPTADPADNETMRPWLVGVLLDNQCYLFDPVLGTPIPGEADTGQTATVLHPATLTEVLANDGLLRKLDRSAEQPYPLTAEQLQKVTVQVIGMRNLWASPMQRLQTALSGDQSAVVYDGLQDDGDLPGLITRVTEAGGEHWTKESIAVWPYPEEQLAASEQRDERQRERLAVLEKPQDAPVPLSFDPATREIRIGKPERRHLRSRITHLMGDFDTAVRNYQTLRIRLVSVAKQPLPDAIRSIHDRAEDDAAYWIGLCQFDKGNYETAVSTFRAYIRRYGKNPNAAWTAQARLMLALSWAETSDLTEANYQLDQLTDVPEPLAARHAYWKRRWTAAMKKSDK